MTFAEFRKRAREIAGELADRDGDEGRRCTSVQLEVWDDEDGGVRVEWNIFDMMRKEHFNANDAEAALTAYRNTLTLDPETVIADAGGPGAAVDEEPSP